MKLKTIIIYYPSFEKGGVENILINISKFFIKSKINIILITSKKIIKNNKHVEYIIVKKKKNRLLTTLLSVTKFIKILICKFSQRENVCILSLQSNSVAIILGKIFGFRVVARNSEYPLGSFLNRDDNFFKSTIVLIQKIIVYNFANLVISNSRGSRDTIRKFVIRNKKVIHIYNPYIKKIKKENLKVKKNVILFVGRFVKQKGIIYLLKAFKSFNEKYNKFELWMVGSGPDIKLIKKYKKDKQLKKKIKIIGWKKNLSKYYNQSKYFILPSIYEGLGNVVIEALNYSRVCLVSNCKHGPKEIINYGKGGYIFKSKSSKDLLKKLVKIEADFENSKKKVKVARRGLDRFLISKQSNKYLKVIKELQ